MTDVWLCAYVEALHCPSCHEDADSFDYPLMEFKAGDCLLYMCCDVARMMGFNYD